jgi:hypothetical protein
VFHKLTHRPPPWKGASRGCLQEMAGTRHFSQLASSSRGSHCSSGNALPLAENANLGVCAIEQFRVRAAGSSQESRTRLASRAGGLRGVVGSGLTGYVCDMWSPSSKPGSQSFSSAEVFLHPPPEFSGPTGRCPMQPNTPLGPDQVNVLLLL